VKTFKISGLVHFSFFKPMIVVSLIFFLFVFLSGCAFTVVGVDVDLRQKSKQSISGSRYLPHEVSNLEELNSYLVRIKDTSRKLVSDDFGSYYHEIKGGYVVQLYVSKIMDGYLRDALETSEVFFFPFYRLTKREDLSEGQCGLNFAYDKNLTKNFIENFNNSGIRAASIGRTEEFVRTGNDFVMKQNGSPGLADEVVQDISKKAIGEALLLVSDASNESRLFFVKENKGDNSKVLPCGLIPGYTLPTSLRIGYYPTKAILELKSNGFGAEAAICSITSVSSLARVFLADKAYKSGSYKSTHNNLTSYNGVKLIRSEMEKIALNFCVEAFNEFKISKSIESEKLK
jgi:hypothetical protein